MQLIGTIARWLLYLSRPAMHLTALCVCVKYRNVSRHMIWVTSGFALLLANWLFPALCSFTESGRGLFPSLGRWYGLAHAVGWAIVVIGLALVLREYELKQSRGELR